VDQRGGSPAIDLCPQAADMGLHDVRLRIEKELPHLFEQHFAGDKPTFVAQQKLEQPEFARLQVYLLAAAPDSSRDKVHFEISCGKDGWGCAQHRPARERHQTGHQFLESERLDEIIVAARFKPVDSVVDACEIREKQHWGCYSFRSQQGHNRKSVELRQHAVENDDVKMLGGRSLDAISSVGDDRRVMPALAQPGCDMSGDLFVVFNDQGFQTPVP
jgi:hypothetical protein